MSDEPTGTPPPPPQDPPADDAWLAELPEQVRKTWEQKNGEAASYRHQLRTAQQAAATERERREQLEREHESEQQRLVREAVERDREAEAGKRDELTAGYERQLAIAAVERKAAGVFADPGDVIRLLPLEDILAETDPRRRDTLIDKLLSKFAQDKPYLLREQTPRPPLVTQGARSERQDGKPRERSWLRT